MKRFRYIIFLLLAFVATAKAADNIVFQSFYNLSARELRIDSLLPEFRTTIALPDNYQDSVYTVEVVYPEYEVMTSAESKRCQEEATAFGEQVTANSQVVVNQKRGYLEVSLVPIVFRNKAFRKVGSFMIRVKSKAGTAARKAARRKAEDNSAASIYADHSILATGRWAKISVSETGIHELTADVIRKAGFSDLSKVRIYGYGGNLQEEAIKAATLKTLDDLKEVPSCYVGNRRLFFGKGTVHYTSSISTRIRNPYSSNGYYFITEGEGTPLTVDQKTFVNEICRSNNDFHVLHELDQYAWFQGGRNLFEDSPIEAGKSKTYHLDLSAYPENTLLYATVVVTAGTNSTFTVAVNDGTPVNGVIKLAEYDKGNSHSCTISFRGNSADVTITANTGGPLRLDYIDINSRTVRKNAPDIATTAFPAAQYVYNIMNQDLHADRDYNMVIIIPTTQKFRSEADRLAAFHEQHDGLKVRVVPADELFNEFSSGTPDANAYRRYMKMLYDRAETPEKAPKYLLLFGAGAFDNRMLTSLWKGKSPDDYLLCFESEYSFSETTSYPNDGFYCLLDEGEGTKQTTTDREDVAVGRLPALTAYEAKAMVDKIIAYVENKNAGVWQNRAVSMGDDGDANAHMRDANMVATTMETTNPAILTRRIMWDTYPMVAASTGNAYPAIEQEIAAQEAAGALIMDYSGHGSAYQLSHEKVIKINLFKTAKSAGLPLWIAAACDVLPYDHNTEYMGKEALLNPNGGAIAFFSAARSVFPKENRDLNMSFVAHLLNKNEGKTMTLGEAQRLAKNEVTSPGRPENKLAYVLIGDPAIRLNLPLQTVIIDSINNVCLKEHPEAIVQLKATSKVVIKGHIENEGVKNEAFNGTMHLTVRDAVHQVKCLLNNDKQAEKPFTYNDRTSYIYKGNALVENGEFTVTFAVPKDIEYSGESGLINAFAVDNATRETANGYCEQFMAADTEDTFNDNVGPSITCYLNTPNFVNGDNVNTTPFFFAEISDQNGINTTGASFGHDLELTIDGDMQKTYILNDNFTFDFGSYTKGQTYYSIPALEPGQHTLQFKAWDILNNSSNVTLNFNVVSGIKPDLTSIYCTNNPARENTVFVVNHNLKGSNVTIEIEVMNMAGRPLWKKTVNEASGIDGTNLIDWNLTTNSGGRLLTGVYLYRVRISSDGSDSVSKAKKLIIL